MFKSLALIAAVAAADITLTGSQDEKSIAAFAVDGVAAKYKVECASKSGYKLDATFVTGWAQNTGKMTTTNANDGTTKTFADPVTGSGIATHGWWLNVALQGALTEATATKGQTYNMQMVNNAKATAASYASQTILTAANMAGGAAVPVAATVGAKVKDGTAAGTAPTATAAGTWVVVELKSLSTVATGAELTASMTLTLEKKITTDFAKWTRKEKMTMGCGGGFGATDETVKIKGAIDTAEWEFGTAGAVATMAGASVVAAAALLF